MNAKNHRQNHNFQIAYFLAGACHTPDGAYSVLCDLKEEREMAIENYRVNQLKERVRQSKAENLLESNHEIDRLEGQAELLEIENNRERGKVLYEAALDELSFINQCIDKIQPLRRFKDLPDPEAHEAAQAVEWKLELVRRAENYMLTAGTISADHFAVMRLHPAFQTDIMPRIKEIQLLMESPEGIKKLEASIVGSDFKLLD